MTGQIVSMSDSTKPTHPQSLLLNTVKSAAEHFNWVVAVSESSVEPVSYLCRLEFVTVIENLK